jgi:hypothetical protein
MGMIQKLERLKQQKRQKVPAGIGIPLGMHEMFPGEELVAGDRLPIHPAVTATLDHFMRVLLSQWQSTPDHETVAYLGMIAIIGNDLSGAFLNLMPMEEGIQHLKALAAKGKLIYSAEVFDDDIRRPVPDHMIPLPIYVYADAKQQCNVGIFFLDKKTLAER